ncbi:MAG: polyprenyl synthetase family protein [Chloroflexi bacterium]|nr:polyprenyl synthetase family protein [Chloroflexota bacterium]
MSLERYSQKMLPAVEAGLKETIQRMIPDDFAELRSMLCYHLGWEGERAGKEAQGKRIRPLLVLLCAEAVKSPWQSALPAAVAVELLHNFSLIHDDIQDQSTVRRGRPTVWARWGMAQAINAGDVMYTLAYAALAGLRETVSPATALQSSEIFHQACLKLTRGQYLDLAYETRQNLEIADYWPMIEGKTAALIAACCELGALAAGADAAAQAAFHQFGHYLGLAFQVLDDWLGLWGDAALTGKSTASDLVTGKKTLPVLYGLSRDGEFARRWWSGPIAAEDARSIAKLLKTEGAQEYTQSTAESLNRQALEALQIASPANEASNALSEFANTLLMRQM